MPADNSTTLLPTLATLSCCGPRSTEAPSADEVSVDRFAGRETTTAVVSRIGELIQADAEIIAGLRTPRSSPGLRSAVCQCRRGEARSAPPVTLWCWLTTSPATSSCSAERRRSACLPRFKGA